MFADVCLHDILLLYYISSENWSRLEIIAFLNLTLTLIFTYFLFVAGAHVTSITALCAATSALLQLLMMVFFCWTVILTLCLYLKLGEVPKRFQKILLCSSMCATWSKSYCILFVHISLILCDVMFYACSTAIGDSKFDSRCLAQSLLHRLLVS